MSMGAAAAGQSGNTSLPQQQPLQQDQRSLPKRSTSDRSPEPGDAAHKTARTDVATGEELRLLLTDTEPMEDARLTVSPTAAGASCSVLQLLSAEDLLPVQSRVRCQ